MQEVFSGKKTKNVDLDAIDNIDVGVNTDGLKMYSTKTPAGTEYETPMQRAFREANAKLNSK